MQKNENKLFSKKFIANLLHRKLVKISENIDTDCKGISVCLHVCEKTRGKLII
jgi:hypothetical protein